MQDITAPQGMKLASWTHAISQSTIQQLLAVATQPDILSFALGLPAAELFPTEAYAEATAHVLTTQHHALQYGMPCEILKHFIVQLMALRGVVCNSKQVFLTTGAQQAMSLLSRLLLDRYAPVLVEETIYSGILQAVEPLQPQLLTVPTDLETGMDLDAVEALLASGHHPAFIYAISDGHNPLGVSLSLEKRQRLVALARQYGIPILEDDAYGFLYYDDEPLPPLRALEEDWVFYIGSFSKILAPALRVGWMIVPESLISVLSALKEGSDINTATLSQRTIAAYLEMGQLPNHIADLRQAYRFRRDTMLRAMTTYFPAGTRCSQPANGMFLWVELPEMVDMEMLLKIAVEQKKIAFVPGWAFSVKRNHAIDRSMRLNFSCCNPERIIYGIGRLGELLSDAI
jgi:2-aminoadipate transaminase